MIADGINASFELLGGLFVLDHCRIALRDGDIKGVSIISTIFFTLWGVWNMYYYPSLGQWLSFYGGIFIVLTNLCWISIHIYYIRRNRARLRLEMSPSYR